MWFSGLADGAFTCRRRPGQGVTHREVDHITFHRNAVARESTPRAIARVEPNRRRPEGDGPLR